MKNILSLPLFLLCLLLSGPGLGEMRAQRIAIKSNALTLSLLSPSLGVEAQVSRHNTLGVEFQGSPFAAGSLSLKHCNVMPEVRHYFSGRPGAHHFVGLMALYSGYSLHLFHRNMRGDALGIGPTYGYCFVLGPRWSLETSLGAGLVHYEMKHYRDGHARPTRRNKVKNMFLPMRAAVSFTYYIR